MKSAIEPPTLTIQLSAEDSDRLLAEAKRRQVDAGSLAQILLHESLREIDRLSVTDIESLEKLYSLRGKQSSDSDRQNIGRNLEKLRRERNQADYNNSIPELYKITKIAVKRSERVISTLNSL